jgi:7-keto-8-aminopelargonate synthetase-like enzyme
MTSDTENRKKSIYESAYEFVSMGAAMGVGLQAIENERFEGRSITLGGKDHVFFGNCSYLGLETDARIKAGAIAAIEKHGIMLSCSRHYLSSAISQELQSLLEQIFLQPCVQFPLTNLASAAIMMTRIEASDAIILDQQVHMSIKMNSDNLKSQGVHVEQIHHNRMDLLESRIQALTQSHRRIWYLADGVYSMFGDCAPMADLYALMDRYENLRVLLDDAHGMSWSGPRGAGFSYSQMPHFHPQLYRVTSLGKAFGGAGAVAICPTARERDIVKTSSPQHIFISPISNAHLGANIASAKIHLSAELPSLQAELQARIALFKSVAQQHNLPLVNPDCVTPIFYIAVGKAELAVLLLKRLMQQGFYVNIASNPAVPKHAPGMRIVLSRHQTQADIEALLSCLSELMDELLPQYQLSKDRIREAFFRREVL